MAVEPQSRTVPRRAHAKRGQQRADRTRELVIEETLRCIQEEGFAAASTRHIIERAGVTWGVIQYHFGDRDGLLSAVIDYGLDTLVTALNELAAEAEALTNTEDIALSLTLAAWRALCTPISMTALEILIATRFMRGNLDMSQLAGLQTALDRISAIIGDSTPHAEGIAGLLWAAPVGMMVAQMVTTDLLPTESQQHALAALISDHLAVASKSPSRATKPQGRTRSRTRQPSR